MFLTYKSPCCFLPRSKLIGLLVQEKTWKNISSRWRPSWISDRNDFSYFWSTSHPYAFYQVFKSTGLSVQEKKQKIVFQDSDHLGVLLKKLKIDFKDGGYPGFPIGTILAIFYLQVTSMLPTKFQVNWPFKSEEEEAKNRFSKWRPSGISIGTLLAIFDLQVTMMLPIKFQSSWPFGKKKIEFQDGGHLESPIGTILDIFIPRHTIVAGYYGFTLVVRESVSLSVCPFCVSGW